MDIIKKYKEIMQSHKEYEDMILASLDFISSNLRVSPLGVREIIDSLLPLAEKQKDFKSLADLYGQKSWTFIDLSDFQTAKELLWQSKKLYGEIDDKHGLVKVYNSLGFCETVIGDIPLALEYYDQALEIALSLDNRPLLSMIYGNLGETFVKLGSLEEAIIYFDKSVVYASSATSKAVSLSGLGACYQGLEEHEKALPYLEEALELVRENKLIVIENYVLGTLSLVYEGMGNFPKALEVLARTMEIVQETNMTKFIGSCNLSFGRIYFKENKKEKALKYLKEAFKIGTEIQDTSMLANSAKFISDIYKESKDWLEALKYFKKFNEERQKLFNEETAKEIQRHKLKEANREIGLLKEMYQQISTLSQMGKEITSYLDLKEVIFTIYGILNKLMETTMFGIGLYDEWREEIVFQLAVENNEWFQPEGISLTREDSFAVKSFKEDQDIIINDLHREYLEHVDSIYSSLPAELEKTQSLLYLPLRLGDKLIGVVTVQSSKKEIYDRNKVEMVKALASYIAIAVENSKLYEKVPKMATLDTVTNIYNRAYFINLAESEFQKFKRNGPAFSLLMFDLDYFKGINDRYGHDVGDLALRHVTSICKKNLRASDLFSRYGGDEFMILLPQTELEEAKIVAEKLLEDLRRSPINLEDGNSFIITASFGLLCVDKKNVSLNEILKKVDLALYQAKNKGRNRVLSS